MVIYCMKWIYLGQNSEPLIDDQHEKAFNGCVKKNKNEFV